MGIVVRRGNNEDIFRTFRDMQRDVDSVFNKALFGNVNTNNSFLMPSVDVYENENEYVFEFELPGLKKEDVKVTVEDNVLTVSSEVAREKKEDVGNYHVSERKFGTFKRQFSLPEDSNLTQIDAKYENGVLELKVQKKEEEKRQCMDVEIK